MLIENAVQIVIVRAQIALQLRTQARIGMIDAARVVVALPELDGAHVGGEENGAAKEGIQRRGEYGRDAGLQEQHGRVRHAKWLSECVERRAPCDLPRRDVGNDEL